MFVLMSAYMYTNGMSIETQSQYNNLEPLPSDMFSLHWDRLANCKGEDTDQFEAPALSDYGKLKKGEEERRREVIARFCAPCVVQTRCLQEAIEQKDVNYIRGAMTPAQRKKLTKKPK